jgi:hypothetical protein
MLWLLAFLLAGFDASNETTVATYSISLLLHPLLGRNSYLYILGSFVKREALVILWKITCVGDDGVVYF